MTAHALVIGGAGFVGSNLADRLLRDGHRVVLLDALVRDNVGLNVAWLQRQHGDRVRLVEGDVRDRQLVRELVAQADQVFHLAAQVAVTTSLVDPEHDFDVNARGTLVVLEALRALRSPPPLLFTSTNKVYGDLEDVALVLRDGRWEPADEALAARGIDESRPLSFHSPYGCSKGCADQYVLDYARTFGLPAAVLRMSCIYGPRQFGTEDQGWLAHFLIQARRGEPITLYGDGRQVRDALFVDDLVEAFVTARDRIEDLAGRAYNLGGGPSRTLSLRQLLDRIEDLARPGSPASAGGWAAGLASAGGSASGGLRVTFGPWRAADQRWYVSDTRGFESATGWTARVGLDEGIERLDRWLATLAPAETPAAAEAVR